MMPYDNREELPETVKEALPAEAQRIYKDAFNAAWEEYAGEKDQEATAHRVAWSAVKKKYEKNDTWRKK